MTDTQEMRAIFGETQKYEELTFADDFMFCKVLLYSCGADTGMGIADAGLPWFWSGSRYRRFVHSYHCLFTRSFSQSYEDVSEEVIERIFVLIKRKLAQN